jgi:3-oxoacid CoA-transferase subunit B
VDVVITDLGVFTIDKTGAAGMTLIELAPDVSVEDVTRLTAAAFTLDPSLKSQAA